MRKFLHAIAALSVSIHWPASAETVKLNGVELHYTVHGSGKPLLLLHSFGSCAADWSAIAPKLAEKRMVIVVDARGHGKSTNPSGKFSHRQAAEDVHALLNALKIQSAQAIGFSSGGMTLLHLATSHPERLSKMVVVGATTHFPEGARAILQSVSTDTLPPDVIAGFRKCAARGEPQVRALVSQFRALGFSTDDMKFEPEDLRRIKADTLIIHGDRDMFFPVSIPASMYAAIKKSQLWIVPNGDHSPTAGATENAFVDVVETFLAN